MLDENIDRYIDPHTRHYKKQEDKNVNKTKQSHRLSFH